ncbi:hypothetical protein BC939DRAFT_438729 [Gamsiella multidivaricata]|uniref:uncharacterized protein n=1 Tax=Gamsiella multidivaricata TaxID=101098 RepID=UPI00221F4ADB|nr:uncharacterized protein BC939DRAFT_438729 [Gamsiella multidivaricata]KAG0365126.1 hypothetical protein BGZ54_006843 [Gamsiella multidivaricata]KAI7830682.1 hypothetical protein BC939DRAFT_438729 [Gamsiella multidivaricata]
MDPIITSMSSTIDTHTDIHDQQDHRLPTATATYHYKKINIPLAYPSEALREQSIAPKAYIYPPLMSPSDEFFSPKQTTATSPTTPQPINIPQGQNRTERGLGRRNSLPVRSSVATKSESLPTLSEISSLPSPPSSPWKRSNSFAKSRQNRAATLIVDETPYPDLPTDVRSWTSGHVAEYLGYSLRLYPRAITEDLGRYVRRTAHLTGAQFIDLREEDLERMQINLKWRSMIMKAVEMLRRQTLRASRVDELNWQDGYDPEKDGSLPSPSVHSSDEDHPSSVHHSPSATTESEATHVQEHTTTSTSTSISMDKQVASHEHQEIDVQELRRGIVEDITSVLLSWKKDQEALAKKKVESSSHTLGFTEGVVIGGLIVAFMMKFSR